MQEASPDFTISLEPYLCGIHFLRLIVICLLLCFPACRQEPKNVRPASQPASTGSTDDIRSGDLIVKRGRGHLSNLIVRTLHEPVPLSHCGVMSRRNDSLFIIHSVAREVSGVDGVQRIAYQEFIKDCIPGYMFVMRYRGSDEDCRRIHDSAGVYLNRGVLFDYEINYSDKQRMNCSELLYHALPGEKRDKIFRTISVQEKKVLAFNSLLDTSKFILVYRR